MNLVPLFSSNVFATIIEEDTDELLDEKSYRDNCNYIEKHGINNPHHGDRVLEYYPKTKEILFKQWLAIAHDILKIPYDYMISTSWITKVKKGDESQTHMHKHSFYSGVYYYDYYDETSAPIEFVSPLMNHQDFLLEPKEFNIHNSTSWSIPPKRKQLIIFPSYLAHHIKINKSDAPRKSLAFNIIPVGSYGEGDGYIDTSWFNVNKPTNS